MTPQQIVGLAVRLFALWLIFITVQTIGVTSVVISTSPQAPGGASPLVYLLPALPLLLGMVLWLFPMAIAHKLVPRTHDRNGLRLPARELTAAASAILGLWALLAALPALAAALILIAAGGGLSALSYYFTLERNVQLLTMGAQCLIALFLIAKPWVVAGWIFPDKPRASNPDPWGESDDNQP